MRFFIYLFLLLSVPAVAFGTAGGPVTYQVNGQSYEGYYVSPSDGAPFVLLIHDWTSSLIWPKNWNRPALPTK
jgi:hypothetical protein